ncbi:UDP-N-acetylglucosamine pyrophosphorylase [Cyclospora cayetanensis]|uniref:UDP-N-acetylglucosamine pyrophosphorylase n=1 Tax=Cyclospora cayetanensis TaxID=88456 RepID=A0A1D3D5J0_9EIME|nr:UDP-N-acetylglucosamine pyrophosphorylase [Cyclospora cayetanensis]
MLRENPSEASGAARKDWPTESGAYCYANVCMHYFSVRFLEALVANRQDLHAHYHAAKKKIPELKLLEKPPEKSSRGAPAQGFLLHAPDAGDPSRWSAVSPDAPNGWKLELFVFDAFPLAQRVLVGSTCTAGREEKGGRRREGGGDCREGGCLEVDRDEEFAPVKCSGPEGSPAADALPAAPLDVDAIAADTPQDAQVRLSRLHAKWIAAATGRRLPLRFEGSKHLLCEVSPLLSYEGEGLDPNCLEGKDTNKPLLLQ